MTQSFQQSGDVRRVAIDESNNSGSITVTIRSTVKNSTWPRNEGIQSDKQLSFEAETCTGCHRPEQQLRKHQCAVRSIAVRSTGNNSTWRCTEGIQARAEISGAEEMCAGCH